MSGVTLSLNGMTALVTGASSGLGPCIVKWLDQAGAAVALHYHSNQDGAETVARDCQNQTAIVQADLGNEAAVKNLFSESVRQLGPISILVNCAAAESQNVEDLNKLSTGQWRATQAANVEAPLLLTQLFAAQGISGSIINISSIEGRRPAPGHAHYATSKAALEMLTEASALELGGLGIRVNAVAPGLIYREGIEQGWPEGVAAWQEAAPLGKLVDPEHIASAVVFLASETSGSISGSVITVDCGLSVKPSW